MAFPGEGLTIRNRRFTFYSSKIGFIIDTPPLAAGVTYFLLQQKEEEDPTELVLACNPTLSLNWSEERM